ncbi:hypothetical protein IJG73_02330 [Candidatus Saccharibacteria bacterium]|nr:hypothetical protein [Candidatus Saccharibacteria bacterium]
MKRVIVKCKLKSPQEFERKLNEIEMNFGPVYWLHDRVYVPRNYQRHSSYPRLILRTEMRAVDKPAKYVMILRRHVEDSGVDIMNRTVVENYAEAANIIMQLGFKPQAEISYQRREIVMSEGTVMYLDKIEGMDGYFAKLEADLDEEKDKVSDVMEDLERTFKVLGQDKSTLVRDAYAELR